MKQLYVISREDLFPGERELINRLFNAGMEIFHLRKPGVSLASFADLLHGIDPAYRHRVVLHQFHEYGPEWGIHNFHFSELKRTSFLKGNDMKELIRKGSLSTSIHSIGKAPELGEFDYSFFGPVFDSISKPLYQGILPQYFIVPALLKLKLVALGGISLKNINQVFEMGFNKVAVLGAIWANPSEAVNSFKRLQKKCLHAEI